ncbi:UNVERIFIED_CONTAM: hypothetical protein NCL1_40454 [Trichonephila clavipes]
MSSSGESCSDGISCVSCIKGDAEEGLKPELDEKADVLDVEGSLLGIGFTGGHSDIIAAIGGVDVKRSASAEDAETEGIDGDIFGFGREES